jgi:hypothetical protein
MFGITLALLVLCIGLTVAQDKDAPKLIFDDQKLVYTEGMDTALLLAGVKATDKKDGDVSDTIMVENIRVLSGSKKASITYVAKDSKNNIAKKNRIVEYQSAGAISITPTPTISPSITPDSSDEPLVSTGKPIIRLTTDRVTLNVGDSFNYANYIKDAVDDKDNVFRRIQIRGNYSTKNPGTYTLTFSATDSDGNRSNEEKLTLVVQ